jgi:hypothetical protein
VNAAGAGLLGQDDARPRRSEPDSQQPEGAVMSTVSEAACATVEDGAVWRHCQRCQALVALPPEASVCERCTDRPVWMVQDRCPYCGGSGRVPVVPASPLDPTCPACQGSGVDPAAPTGDRRRSP